ncbi:MAG TPA: dUTP diphosphatase, partial [Candidatus Nanoarchaeia archaeon]|nr:dUTP diphosphatase [Candidatus Nanoarchaeia archaeon]
KSGLALKEGISIVNTPGTVDSNYRGELGVILINHSGRSFLVEKGKKIAQIVLQKVETIKFKEVENLNKTTRGSGGFGSTGLVKHQ